MTYETFAERAARERTEKLAHNEMLTAVYVGMLEGIETLDSVTAGPLKTDEGYPMDPKATAVVSGTPMTVQLSMGWPHRQWTAYLGLPHAFDKYRTAARFSIHGTRLGTAGAKDIARRLLTADNLAKLADDAKRHTEADSHTDSMRQWFGTWLQQARGTAGVTVTKWPAEHSASAYVDGLTLDVKVRDSGCLDAIVRISSTAAVEAVMLALATLASQTASQTKETAK